MKLSAKFLSVIIISFACAQAAHGQVIFGAKAGFNVNKVVFEDQFFVGSDDIELTFGFHGGFLARIKLGDKFFLQPELLFSQKGWKSSGDDGFDTRHKLHYLNVPLLAGYHLSDRFSVLLGPEVGFKLSEKVGSIVLDDLYENFDIGIIAGVNYKITSKLGIDLRYCYGFKGLVEMEFRDINNNSLGKFRDGGNRVFQLGVFYFLGRGLDG